MTDHLERFRRDYAAAFLRYLSQRNEASLWTAYELGRRGLAHRISLLDIVQVHHAVLLDVAGDTEELHALADTAAAFLVEALASFEMAQRGFMEGRRRRDAPPATDT